MVNTEELSIDMSLTYYADIEIENYGSIEVPENWKVSIIDDFYYFSICIGAKCAIKVLIPTPINATSTF